jgi:hypothetical protein
MPQSTNPSANERYVGQRVQSANPAPAKRGAIATSVRREKRSAQTPEGISRTNPVSDQRAKSEEISADERPWSAK